MTKGKEINQSADLPVGPVQPTPPGSVQVTQGNVSIVTVELLNDINIKLGKILVKLEERIG